MLTPGAKLALVGSAIGLLGAFGVSRLIAIAQVACYLPARHASRINPTETLRAE